MVLGARGKRRHSPPIDLRRPSFADLSESDQMVARRRESRR